MHNLWSTKPNTIRVIHYTPNFSVHIAMCCHFPNLTTITTNQSAVIIVYGNIKIHNGNRRMTPEYWFGGIKRQHCIQYIWKPNTFCVAITNSMITYISIKHHDYPMVLRRKSPFVLTLNKLMARRANNEWLWLSSVWSMAMWNSKYLETIALITQSHDLLTHISRHNTITTKNH